MGYKEYHALSEKYNIPIIITGFEPLDLVQGIQMAVDQLESGNHKVANQYARVVKEEGNLNAIQIIRQVFEIGDREWRGIGMIPKSGYRLTKEFIAFDAERRFGIQGIKVDEHPSCMAGEILKGIKKPIDCPEFGKACSPAKPLGAPMVSSEGACSAYYNFSQY